MSSVKNSKIGSCFNKFYGVVLETLERVLESARRGKLYPVISSDKFYNAVIEYLADKYLELRDNYCDENIYAGFVLMKNVNAEKIAGRIAEEYEHYFRVNTYS